MLPREINDSEAYDFEYLPKAQPLSVIEQASFKSQDEDFGNAVKKIYKRLKKNVVLIVPEFDVVLKVTKTINQGDYPSVHYAIGDTDVALMTTKLYDAHKGFTLRFVKIKDGEPKHLLLLIKTFKYLIDNIIDENISDAKLATYIQSDLALKKKKEDVCQPCG